MFSCLFHVRFGYRMVKVAPQGLEKGENTSEHTLKKDVMGCHRSGPIIPFLAAEG